MRNFQYSIGDASPGSLYIMAPLCVVLSILHWRCQIVEPPDGQPRLLFFQYSIGDARHDTAAGCSTTLGETFQYSIGDAR